MQGRWVGRNWMAEGSILRLGVGVRKARVDLERGEFVKQGCRSVVVLAAALLLAMVCLGQTSGKKEYTFHGKVEAVDKGAKSLRVNGEKVEGWMGAMTMDYKLDNPAILDKLKPGDRIMATVYDGDYTLHQVKPMAPAADSKSKK